MREVGQAVGLKSASSALSHIRALESEGVISGGGVPRSLVVKEVCDRDTVVQRICVELDDGRKMTWNARSKSLRVLLSMSPSTGFVTKYSPGMWLFAGGSCLCDDLLGLKLRHS